MLHKLVAGASKSLPTLTRKRAPKITSGGKNSTSLQDQMRLINLIRDKLWLIKKHDKCHKEKPKSGGVVDIFFYNFDSRIAPTSPIQASRGHGFFLLIEVEARTSNSSFIFLVFGVYQTDILRHCHVHLVVLNVLWLNSFSSCVFNLKPTQRYLGGT